MRKVLIAIMVGGAFALTSVGALAQTSSTNGLESKGEAALEALQQARIDCFATLYATYKANPVKGSNSQKAKDALAAAKAALDAVYVPKLVALETALENFDDEDGVVIGAQALIDATAAAQAATLQLPIDCAAANTALAQTLINLANTSTPTKDEDDEDDADDADGDGAHHNTHAKVEVREHETKPAGRD
jgi:hypothetical protein